LSLSGTTAVNVSPADNDLRKVPGLTVHGGGGTALTLNDQANPYASNLFFRRTIQYTVTATAFQSDLKVVGPLGPSSSTLAVVTYDGLAGLDVNLGNHTNVVNLEGLPGPTQIAAGTGSNVVNVSPTSQRLAGMGRLGLSGAGDTTLNLYDQADTAGWISPNAWDFEDEFGDQVATLDATFNQGPPEQVFSVNYSGVTSASLFAAQSPNQVSVQVVDYPTAITAGTSSDVITVAAPKLVRYLGQQPLTVRGGQLVVADTGLQSYATAFDVYTYSVGYSVTSKSVALDETLKDVYNALAAWNAKHPPNQTYKGPQYITTTSHYSQQINYGNLQGLTLNAGPEAATITVGDKGSVRSLSIPLTLSGQGASTSVVVDDSGCTLRDVLTIANGKSGDVQVGTGAQDQFFGAGGSLDCGGIGSLTVNLSKAANDVVHLSPSAVTAFTINGDSSQYQAGFGAELDLVLGGTTDDVLTPGVPGAGTWGFSKGSHKSISFTNVKTTQAQ
jgi:hypothetical protein